MKIINKKCKIEGNSKFKIVQNQENPSLQTIQFYSPNQKFFLRGSFKLTIEFGSFEIGGFTFEHDPHSFHSPTPEIIIWNNYYFNSKKYLENMKKNTNETQLFYFDQDILISNLPEKRNFEIKKENKTKIPISSIEIEIYYKDYFCKDMEFLLSSCDRFPPWFGISKKIQLSEPKMTISTEPLIYFSQEEIWKKNLDSIFSSLSPKKLEKWIFFSTLQNRNLLFFSINKFLKIYGKCYILEIGSNATQFGIPGTISLTLLENPIFNPLEDFKSKLSYFVGDKPSGNYWLECCLKLYEEYETNSKKIKDNNNNNQKNLKNIPLIISSNLLYQNQGNFSLDLLNHFVEISKISKGLVLNPKKNQQHCLTKISFPISSLQAKEFCSTESTSHVYVNPFYRTFQLGIYFNSLNFLEIENVILPWNQFLIFVDCKFPPSQIMHLLNCSYLGFGKRSKEMEIKFKNQKEKDFILKNGLPTLIENFENNNNFIPCQGLTFLRDIDGIKKEFSFVVPFLEKQKLLNSDVLFFSSNYSSPSLLTTNETFLKMGWTPYGTETSLSHVFPNSIV